VTFGLLKFSDAFQAGTLCLPLGPAPAANLRSKSAIEQLILVDSEPCAANLGAVHCRKPRIRVTFPALLRASSFHCCALPIRSLDPNPATLVCQEGDKLHNSRASCMYTPNIGFGRWPFVFSRMMHPKYDTRNCEMSATARIWPCPAPSHVLPLPLAPAAGGLQPDQIARPGQRWMMPVEVPHHQPTPLSHYQSVDATKSCGSLPAQHWIVKSSRSDNILESEPVPRSQ
jgi:hypothetical protein